jgi:arylsulfatase A-like enzyme
MRWARVAGASAALATLACSDEGPTQAAGGPPGPPQVLLLTLDTVRADALGCYGNPRPVTPRLDELARGGTRFERAMAPMPETVPSHASMLTGQPPLAHGVTNNYLALSSDAQTLPELLALAGVATGAFFHVMPFDQMKLTQGFERQARDVSADASGLCGSFFRWLDAQPADRPLFSWVHCYLAHEPFAPPAELEARLVEHRYGGPLDFSIETRANLRKVPESVPDGYVRHLHELYEADVAWLDARVGELVSGLRARGRLDGTLLVVVADHGEEFERGALGSHAFFERQGTLHVPLFLAGPGVPAGETVGEIVELADLFPTILEAFGVGPPSGIEGRSLWPLVRGGGDAWDGVGFATLPTFLEQHAAGKLPGKLVAWSGRFKLVVSDVNKERKEALFDLEADAEETRDVSAEHPGAARALRQRLEERIERARAATLPPSPVDAETARILEPLGYGR